MALEIDETNRKVNFFDEAYEGTPAWEIGRPQEEFARLADLGDIAGSILDVGCGTGENSLFLAGRGLRVVGIDSSAVAVARATEKARQRRINAEFRTHDALDLPSLGREFDTVIDSGLFHVFSDEERPVFVQSLGNVLRNGGRYFMLCFSDQEPRGWGPRRISKRRIRLTFAEGWNVESIRPAFFQTNRPEGVAHAWLSSIRKIGRGIRAND